MSGSVIQCSNVDDKRFFRQNFLRCVGLRFVRLKRFEDLVKLVVSSPMGGVIQHAEVGGRHVYFVIAGTASDSFVYLVSVEQPVEKPYVVYDAVSGEIRLSEEAEIGPNVSSIPIIEVERQDIIPEEALK